MTDVQHRDLANGRWHQLSLAEQLGNIGSEISRAARWSGRNDELSRGALERALELFDLTLDDPRHRRSPARLRELAQVVNSIGYAKFRAGDYPGALESYQQGLGLTRQLADADKTNPGAQRDLALVLASIGDAKLDSGDNPGALDAYQQSLAIRRTLAAADPGNTDLKRDMAASLSGIGDALLNTGDKEKALVAYEEGVGLVRELTAVDA